MYEGLSGTEDFFDSGWYFNAGEFHSPVSGFTHLVSTKNKTEWSAYRFHEMDPLRFADGVKSEWPAVPSTPGPALPNPFGSRTLLLRGSIWPINVVAVFPPFLCPFLFSSRLYTVPPLHPLLPADSLTHPPSIGRCARPDRSHLAVRRHDGPCRQWRRQVFHAGDRRQPGWYPYV